jgi:hypothetical protein
MFQRCMSSEFLQRFGLLQDFRMFSFCSPKVTSQFNQRIASKREEFDREAFSSLVSAAGFLRNTSLKTFAISPVLNCTQPKPGL